MAARSIASGTSAKFSPGRPYESDLRRTSGHRGTVGIGPFQTGRRHLHPGAVARYEQQVGRLEDAIINGLKAGETEAAAVIRELIESVTVRRQVDGVEVE